MGAGGVDDCATFPLLSCSCLFSALGPELPPLLLHVSVGQATPGLLPLLIVLEPEKIRRWRKEGTGGGNGQQGPGTGTVCKIWGAGGREEGREVTDVWHRHVW